MKKYGLKNAKYYLLLLIIIISFTILAGCGNENGEGDYEYGNFSGNIESKYELVAGTSGQTAVNGKFKIVVINYAQTKDGGWVAWKDNKYAYTSKNVKSSICSSFALHFKYIEATKF